MDAIETKELRDGFYVAQLDIGDQDPYDCLFAISNRPWVTTSDGTPAGQAENLRLAGGHDGQMHLIIDLKIVVKKIQEELLEGTAIFVDGLRVIGPFEG